MCTLCANLTDPRPRGIHSKGCMSCTRSTSAVAKRPSWSPHAHRGWRRCEREWPPRDQTLSPRSAIASAHALRRRRVGSLLGSRSLSTRPHWSIGVSADENALAAVIPGYVADDGRRRRAVRKTAPPDWYAGVQGDGATQAHTSTLGATRVGPSEPDAGRASPDSIPYQSVDAVMRESSTLVSAPVSTLVGMSTTCS